MRDRAPGPGVTPKAGQLTEDRLDRAAGRRIGQGTAAEIEIESSMKEIQGSTY